MSAGNDPSLADLVDEPGRLPSELARQRLSLPGRVQIAAMFFQKLGFELVGKPHTKADGTTTFTVRPT